MADPGRMSVADGSRILPVRSAAGAGYVVFGAVRQDLKFFHKVLHRHSSIREPLFPVDRRSIYREIIIARCERTFNIENECFC